MRWRRSSGDKAAISSSSSIVSRSRCFSGDSVSHSMQTSSVPEDDVALACASRSRMRSQRSDGDKGTSSAALGGRAASQRSKIRDLHDLAEIASRDLNRALAVLKLWNSGGARRRRRCREPRILSTGCSPCTLGLRRERGSGSACVSSGPGCRSARGEPPCWPDAGLTGRRNACRGRGQRPRVPVLLCASGIVTRKGGDGTPGTVAIEPGPRQRRRPISSATSHRLRCRSSAPCR